MNVKKYRATTTREALEQVKQELGDDAFVLETKQVRSGGFFGIRSRKEIEISAASADFAERPEEFFKPEKTSGLKLVDDTSAFPTERQVVNPNSREKILNALAIRAASSKNVDGIIPRVAKELQQNPANGKTPIEVVELSSREPQIVHPRNRQNRPTEQTVTATALAPERSEITRSDFEQIRAELREVKFTLNAFGATVRSPVDDFDFDRDGGIFDYPFYDSYLEISKTGLDPVRIKRELSSFVPQFSKAALPAGNLSRLVIKKMLGSTLRFSGDPLENTKHLAVIGATGVGKTTTIAKLAARAVLQDGKRVELVTLDTYRIAAVEQLKTYAEIIGAGCHVVRSVAELDATLERIGDDATVLIDTTGRSPYDLSDQYEVSDYLLNHDGIHKCLAVQATLNSYDALAAVKKFEMYGADSLVLTKLDETSRPGSILDTVSSSSLPISYFCMGQRVPEDIKIASTEAITEQIMPRSDSNFKKSA